MNANVELQNYAGMQSLAHADVNNVHTDTGPPLPRTSFLSANKLPTAAAFSAAIHSHQQHTFSFSSSKEGAGHISISLILWFIIALSLQNLLKTQSECRALSQANNKLVFLWHGKSLVYMIQVWPEITEMSFCVYFLYAVDANVQPGSYQGI